MVSNVQLLVPHGGIFASLIPGAVTNLLPMGSRSSRELSSQPGCFSSSSVRLPSRCRPGLITRSKRILH